jgi:hypothetical protein
MLQCGILHCAKSAPADSAELNTTQNSLPHPYAAPLFSMHEAPGAATGG